MALRLLVDLYHAQNLREDGGVSRRVVWQAYERIKIGEQGQFVVWGFRGGDTTTTNWNNDITPPHRRKTLTEQEIAAGCNNAVDFFRRLQHLTDLGLGEWVPYLVESADESGETIHPLGLGSSDTIEDRLGRAARDAASALLTDNQYAWAVENYIDYLVPALRHIANVQMIGILRLRYRPHTSMTAAWWHNLQTNAEKHLAKYAEIARDCAKRAAI